jgi:antirestriction protein ArdC
MRFDQLCDQITNQIVDAIDTGSTGVWRAPWHHNGQAELFAPTNLVTGNRYAGTNILQLAFAAIEAGWDQATFATYRQLQSVGAQVRRGEHGTRCVKWVTKTVDTDDADGPVGVLVPKVFTVFNVAQTDGYEPPEPVTFDTDPIENVEAFIAATGAYIDVGHNTAKYRPLIDRIQIPAINQYRTAEDHYATCLHELCHWSGHSSRLNRQLENRFGDDAYAVEELIAELGAAFACGRLGISNQPRPDHADYLASWLRILKADSRALITAASQAQAAVDHLASYSQPTTSEVSGSEVAA